MKIKKFSTFKKLKLTKCVIEAVRSNDDVDRRKADKNIINPAPANVSDGNIGKAIHF